MDENKIDETKIKNNLHTNFIGQNIYLYNETDSTNTRAKENSHLPCGSVFIAEYQTSGKGSKGRIWSSPDGENIYISILLKPSIPPLEASKITLVTGLAVCKSIGLDTKIKWPNDIITGGKKLCGILSEMSSDTDTINYIVCGIGINVNTAKFDDELTDKATSLFLQTEKKHDRNTLIAKLLNEFEYYYTEFLNNGMKFLLNEYKNNCITLGRDVKVIYNNDTLIAKAVDINDDGSLKVETANGTLNVTHGDVSVRGIYGYV